MHRLRKLSSSQRGQTQDPLPAPPSYRVQDSPRSQVATRIPVPVLPPTDDFRTSLILPDLTRRFTLLQSSTGDPLPIDDLRTKFAEQRARGAENALSELEADMLLATLGRLRAKSSVSSADTSMSAGGDSGYNVSSARSSDISTSVASSRTSSKRHSNNLFGSGRFRDASYLRSVQQQQHRNGSGRSALSTASNSSSRTRDDSDSLDVGVVEQTLSRALPRDQLHRASMALDEVIREIEEEAEAVEDGDDDKVLVPRSPVDSRGVARAVASSSSGNTLHAHETGAAFSADYPVEDVSDYRQSPSPYPRSNNTSPTPRLPGYIPGMPRPMTPRDFTLESDDASTATPRAMSPLSPEERRSPAPGNIYRHNSARNNGARTSNSQFISRPLHGRRTPDNQLSSPEKPSQYTYNSGRFTPDPAPPGLNARHARNGSATTADDSFMDFGTPPDSSILGARLRPATPQSPTVYQSMALSGGGSRPSTPSNVTWKLPTESSVDYHTGHGRNGSNLSSIDLSDRAAPPTGGRFRSGSVQGYSHYHNDSVTESAEGYTFGRAISPSSAAGGRSLRSPPLPDSPFVDGGTSFSSLPPENRPPSVTSGFELDSPGIPPTNVFRSTTPTGQHTIMPTSPTMLDSDRSHSRSNSRSDQYGSRQGASSPFSLHQSRTLLFSPIANSSRSSLESAGSSYHSWDGESKEDRVLPLLTAIEQPSPAWHDLAGRDKSSASTSGADSADDTVQQYAGLTKSDFLAVQERLISAWNAKSEATLARERTNSLKRRRASASQPVAALTTQETVPAPDSPVSRGQKALLDSVLDSIVSPREKTGQTSSSDEAPLSPARSEASSTTRRRRAALADALFGGGDLDASRDDPSFAIGSFQTSDDPPSSAPSLQIFEANVRPEPTSSTPVPQEPVLVQSQSSTLGAQSPSASAPALALPDQSDLTLEVQRRADAAMALLNKNPSSPHLPGQASPILKKRIDPSLISSPRLDWASTSVDAIPLPQSSGSPPSTTLSPATSSKLSARFAKKLRGTLRAKPVPNGEEVSPFTLMSPPSAQPIAQNPAYLSPLPASPQPSRGQDADRFKVHVNTPPASAGPGVKGFMSRFRKNRTQDGRDSERSQQFSTHSPSSSSALSGASDIVHFSTNVSEVRSAPAESVTFHGVHVIGPSSTSATLDDSELLTSAPAMGSYQGTSIDSNHQQPEGQNDTTDDQAALKQLFDAASNLGLDQAALTDLLARSPSLSTKRSTTTTAFKHASATPSTAPSWVDPSRAASPQAGSTRATSPISTSGRPSFEQTVKTTIPAGAMATPQRTDSVPGLALRKQTARKSTATQRSTVVRRTIIMPSDFRQSVVPSPMPASPSPMVIPPSPPPPKRKGSTRRHRSASVSSTFSSSVHDRAPTPPPPKSPPSSRFPPEVSPPVPQVPLSFMPSSLGATAYLAAPSPMEKSNSAYDSLYDMYASDSRPTIITTGDTSNQPTSTFETLNNLEPGSAVEVLEMANGETVWNIVKGLREDTLDTESFYGNRASFLSEYSLGGDEGVQVFFKEHARKSSKDSTSSFMSRRKPPQAQSKRPETKVFYSSPTQIGRLIENLSQGLGVDSGSFNIVPGAPSAPRSHSPSHTAPQSYHSESSANWTVEERIERMLASNNGT